MDKKRNSKPTNVNKNITLSLKNIRCFSEKQDFDIRPLTFLVGENSTGKTTVMSCFSILMDIMKGRKPDFNREPYSMGSFQDIATKKTVEGQDAFEISCESSESDKYNIYFIKKDKSAEPIIQKYNVEFNNGLFFNVNNGSQKLHIKYKDKIDETISLKELPFHSTYDFMANPLDILYFIGRVYLRNYERHKKDNKNHQKENIVTKNNKKITEIMNELESVTGNMPRKRNFFQDIVSLAPVRSKPRRTYDPIRVIPDPEGSEIPVTLMRLSNEGADWKKMKQQLISFGEASGLFSDIEVKQYGGSIGEPFQLQFQIRGFKSNIMDVGYGVSQILPLLVRLFYPKPRHKDSYVRFFSRSSESRFLLQQPEVHLHPKAQAEFLSLLIEKIKEKNSFLIETHSDYMMDRARIDIRRGKISHEDVSLIYLEAQKQGGVKAHNLFFDKDGNLMNPPKGYREFFIKESDRFLGFED